MDEYTRTTNEKVFIIKGREFHVVLNSLQYRDYPTEFTAQIYMKVLTVSLRNSLHYGYCYRFHKYNEKEFKKWLKRQIKEMLKIHKDKKVFNL